jgi:uncharacterized ubiquitin-like protein YukD
LIVQKEHIRCFAENVMSLSLPDAQALTELVSIAHNWKQVNIDTLSTPSARSQVAMSMLLGEYALSDVPRDSPVHEALRIVMESEPIPTPALPGSVIRQKEVTAEVLAELQRSPIYIDQQGESVIEALQYAATLRDPVAFVASNPAGTNPASSETASDVYAWRMFQNVYSVLQQYKAINGTKATELGSLVGSLTGDNELWLALVLQSTMLQGLREAVSYLFFHVN